VSLCGELPDGGELLLRVEEALVAAGDVVVDLQEDWMGTNQADRVEHKSGERSRSTTSIDCLGGGRGAAHSSM